MRAFVALMITLLLLTGIAGAQDALTDESTLLLYSTVERMLSGDMENAVDVPTVESDLRAFPADWIVIGLGTTNQPLRNGEMMPDGTVADVEYWWADPSSASEADIVDIAPDADDTEATPEASVDPEPAFPFLGLAVADPEDALVFSAEAVEDVHVWLRALLEEEGITLAGVRLDGTFAEVTTTVAYNIPLTGLDLSGGYVGDDYFRFGAYETTVWRINGLYAADPDLHAVVSTHGNPLHLHGYQPDTMLGGHIATATAIEVTATLYPLANIRQELNDPPADAD